MTPVELAISDSRRTSRPMEAATAALEAEPVDLGSSRKIPILMEMVRELSRASDPRDVLRSFSSGMLRLYGPRGYISLSTRGLAPGEYKITRLITSGSLFDMNTPDPWKDWAVLPTLRGGFLGEVIREPRPMLFHNLYLQQDPVLGDKLAKYGSLVAVPLFEQGEALNWSISLREEADGFTIEDLEEMILRANLGGATVRNVMMTQQLREANDRINREVREIARIQRSLLPPALPQLPGIRIAASYETFDTAGGDLYDFMVLPAPQDGPTRFDGWLAMMIADASGHGPAAAVLTAMLNTLVYAYPRRGAGPGAVFEFANHHLHSKRLDGMFTTAFLAVLNPKDRTLVYARAGHNPPLLKNPGAGGAVAVLDAVGGVPLGILDDVKFEDGVMQLQPGQTLVLYTDGITEALNPQGEMFGVEGIARALEQCTGEPECVINSVTTALRAHEAGMRPRDDQTIVALKIDG